MRVDCANISVIICAYTLDRWSDLVAAIGSVREQTLAPAQLIVVIDHNNELLARAVDAFPQATVVSSTGPRGLSGARCVLLVERTDGGGGLPANRVVGVNPARRRAWAATPEVGALCDAACAAPAARLYRRGDASDVAETLGGEGFDLSMAFPLDAGSVSGGAMLVLGLPDETHLASVMGLLDTLSPVVALVLRNALLFDEQERLIVRRTVELQQANERLRLELAERRRSEAALAVHERELRTLVENIPDLVVRYDTSLHRTLVNPAWEAASGLAADEVVNVPADEIPRVPNPTHDGYLDALRQALEDGAPQVVEFTWTNAHGEPVPLEYRIVPERDAQGRITSLLALGRDLSAAKRAEETLRRLNRELRAISACNQVLVRAVDEQALLDEICRIVCDEAGYRMAWVGFAEHDEAKTVRPVAWAGTEDDYLATADIRWADIDRGRGPGAATGTRAR